MNKYKFIENLNFFPLWHNSS